MKQPAVLAALEKIKKDAIATATSAFIKAQQKKMVAAATVANTKDADDGEASGDSGSG